MRGRGALTRDGLGVSFTPSARLFMRSDVRIEGGDRDAGGQATSGTSNLRPDSTGLSFVVFISQDEGARHAARVRWAPQARVERGALGTYAISPFEHERGPRLDVEGERALARWVALNRDTLQEYWDGGIGYTQDALARLKRI